MTRDDPRSWPEIQWPRDKQGTYINSAGLGQPYQEAPESPCQPGTANYDALLRLGGMFRD